MIDTFECGSNLYSIITINFNNLEGLKKTVNSVFCQEFKEFEYLIIDGGSTDGSKEYLNSIKTNENLTIISEKDKGIYDAMNKGINLSRGKYLIFMNSGDCFKDSLVLRLLSLDLKSTEINIKFLYGDTFEMNFNSSNKLYKKAKMHSNAWYGMFAHHQSMLFSNEIVKNNNIQYNLKYPLSADWDFVLQFLKLIDENEILYKNEVISIFELGGFSSNFIQGIKEQYLIRRNNLGWSILPCINIAIVHYLLNSIRIKMPFIYRYYTQFRSTILN